MDKTTFDYLQPTDLQKTKMENVRSAARQYQELLQEVVPEGPDKTYLIRKLREVAVWANIAITRLPDGTPRE